MKKITTAKQLDNLKLPAGKARIEVSDGKSALRIRLGRRKTSFIWTVQDAAGKVCGYGSTEAAALVHALERAP